MKKIHYRQGDVLIQRIEKIPKKAKPQKESSSIILAHGEVTGHHHTLQSADPVDWWKEGEIPSTNEKPTTLVGALFVSLDQNCSVKHQEHSEIQLPKGNYRITRQREYSPEAIRNVAD